MFKKCFYLDIKIMHYVFRGITALVDYIQQYVSVVGKFVHIKYSREMDVSVLIMNHIITNVMRYIINNSLNINCNCKVIHRIKTREEIFGKG